MNGWMTTRSGAMFIPADPENHEYRITDIASALSKICRYGGHCIEFYSVAEHCVHMAHEAPLQYALEALMHDSAEAYLVDVPRPVKALLRDYRPLEHRIEATIAGQFNLVFDLENGWPPVVKELDNQMLITEQRQNMPNGPSYLPEIEPIPGLKLQCWEPRRAEAEFLSAFHHYSAMR